MDWIKDGVEIDISDRKGDMDFYFVQKNLKSSIRKDI